MRIATEISGWADQSGSGDGNGRRQLTTFVNEWLTNLFILMYLRVELDLQSSSC
jgi:hypothetical protein